MTAPQITVVERDYPTPSSAFTALGPLLDKLGSGGKGINWNTQTEVEQLGAERRVREEGVTQGRKSSPTSTPPGGDDAGPGPTAMWPCKAWRRWANKPARPQPPGAAPRGRENPLSRHPGAAAQDHLLAHLERAGSEKVSYNAGYTNVHELIPWRTLTGRQQFYQDHPGCAPLARALSATARR